jgi:hypothetical protein
METDAARKMSLMRRVDHGGQQQNSDQNSFGNKYPGQGKGTSKEQLTEKVMYVIR